MKGPRKRLFDTAITTHIVESGAPQGSGRRYQPARSSVRVTGGHMLIAGARLERHDNANELLGYTKLVLQGFHVNVAFQWSHRGGRPLQIFRALGYVPVCGRMHTLFTKYNSRHSHIAEG